MTITAGSKCGAPTVIAFGVISALCSLSAPAQDSNAGEALFATYGCYQCHGYAGQGGVAGPRIAPSPYPYLAFAQLVRRPADVMPAYSAEVLDNATLQAIYDYVRSIAEPPALADIPALQ